MDTKTSEMPWTEGDECEAHARAHELIADRMRTTGRDSSHPSTRDEERFRMWLALEMNLDPLRIDDEVHLVRTLARASDAARAAIVEHRRACGRVVLKLAEGTHVRATSIGLQRGKASAKAWRMARGLPLKSIETAREIAARIGGVALSITRIRRAK